MRRHLLVLALLIAPPVAGAAGAAPHVVAKIRVGSQPCAGVAAFGSFWQTNYGTSTLSRINPRTNKVTRTGRLGAQRAGSRPAQAASGSTATAPRRSNVSTGARSRS